MMEQKIVDVHDASKIDVSKLNDREFDEYLKKSEIEHTAKVSDLIKYLKEHFKPEDKLCWMDCVEGVRNDCRYIPKEDLGTHRFIYVSKEKKILEDSQHGYLKSHNGDGEKHMSPKEYADSFYPYVNDSDVLVY